jgi:hypothetical protein
MKLQQAAGFFFNFVTWKCSVEPLEVFKGSLFVTERFEAE